MNNEAAEILSHTAATPSRDIQDFLTEIRKSSIRPSEAKKAKNYTEYYTGIPVATIQSIAHIYKNDIELLGYPKHPFL